MPVKRPHTKSRTGCRVCRTRRVKCDEVRPVCGQCKRRAIECQYDRTTFISHNTSRENVESISTSSATSSPGCTVPVIIESPKKPPFFGQPTTRMMELQLMNHYTILHVVYPKYTSPKVEMLWAYGIPQQAVGRDYLMNALLSLAALHLHIQRPNDVQMALISHYTTVRTLQNMQHQIANITTANAPMTFAASMLIQFHTFVSWKDPCTATGSYELPIRWFSIAQGTANILRAASAHFQHQDLITRIPESQDEEKQSDDPFGSAYALLDDQNRPEDKPVLYEALNLAHSIYKAVMEGQSVGLLRRLVHRFPTRINVKFIELLKQHDPIAMIILGYYFAALKMAGDVWWLIGRADYEIKGITEILPDVWKPFMAWPLEVVGVEPNRNEKTEWNRNYRDWKK